jgi:hypothetical protein
VNASLQQAWSLLRTGSVDDAVSELSEMLMLLPELDEDRALPLHVLALIELERQAGLQALNGLLAEAMAVERSCGHESIALHTSHQLALLTQAGATLSRVGSYYKETYGTLEAMRNRHGAAFCLKSMAEIYLARGKADGAERLLTQAQSLLVAASDPAAQHVERWSRAIRPEG